MKKQNIKHVIIEPEDFTDRFNIPGTNQNPFHKLAAIHQSFSIIPAPLYLLFLSGLFYLFTHDLTRTLLFSGAMFLDFLLISFLPILRISFGPPTFTLIALTFLRMPFLFFNLSIALCFQIFGTLFVVYGFFIEPQYPRLEEYDIALPSSMERPVEIRIVHLSDLHLEFATAREQRIIQLVNSLSPDLILFTGDFFNLSYQDDPDSLKDIVWFFNQLNASYGIYAVTGSPSVDLPESMERILPALNLQLINQSIVDLSIKGVRVRLTGLECTHHPSQDAEILKNFFDYSQTDANILLYHSPDITPTINTLPIDLQLSGHSHGGQVQLPIIGPIFTGSLYGRNFSSGFCRVNDSLLLIISRGLGLEGDFAPRVRFLSPPEVGLVTLAFGGDNVK